MRGREQRVIRSVDPLSTERSGCALSKVLRIPPLVPDAHLNIDAHPNPDAHTYTNAPLAYPDAHTYPNALHTAAKPRHPPFGCTHFATTADRHLSEGSSHMAGR